MKKTILLLLFLSLLLTSCKMEENNEPTQEAVACGKEALQIGENYINKTLSGEDACAKLSTVAGKMSYAKEYAYKDGSERSDYEIQDCIDELMDSINQDSRALSEVGSEDVVKNNINALKALVK